jgi:hypothetical protein
MKNKTAVEFLTDKLFNELQFAFSNNILEEAKKIEKKQFVDFFMWFRDNGERYIGLSIEQFVDEFYKQKFK